MRESRTLEYKESIINTFLKTVSAFGIETEAVLFVYLFF